MVWLNMFVGVHQIDTKQENIKQKQIVFLAFSPLSGMILDYINTNFDAVFPIDGLRLTIFRAFWKTHFRSFKDNGNNVANKII